MGLTVEQLESIQADALADDVEIDEGRMRCWTESQARAYFESGGVAEPGGRIWALSDVHIDRPANRAWLQSIYDDSSYAADVVVLAGDVSDDPELLHECLAGLARAFARCVFVPGNHDLWLRKGSSAKDSAERMQEIFELCSELEVATRPCFAAGAVIAPILSWHHQSWDTEPPLTGWSGIAAPEHGVVDYYRCRWPEPLSQSDDSVAEYVDSLNDTRTAEGSFESEVAALRAAHPGAPLITLSHFVPRIELYPEKRFLFNPTLAKVVGSTPLCRRVEALKPNAHIFGHTHFGWDAVVNGIRYMQPCLGYPEERRIRLSTVATGDFPQGRNGSYPATPLLIWDGGARGERDGFPPPYPTGWCRFYSLYRRRPELTHMVPSYVAARLKRESGGEVGWGPGVEHAAWQLGPKSALEAERAGGVEPTPM